MSAITPATKAMTNRISSNSHGRKFIFPPLTFNSYKWTWLIQLSEDDSLVNPAGHGYLFSMCGHVFGDAPGLLECETLDDAQHHFAVAETCVAAAQMLRRLFEGEIPRETV